MSDEQHPEIIDIGLPPAAPPLSDAVLEQISVGLIVNIHDAPARSMARELLERRREASK